MSATRPANRATVWKVGDITPEVARALRVLLLLAVIGGAVLLTSQIMAKAQQPARRLLRV